MYWPFSFQELRSKGAKESDRVVAVYAIFLLDSLVFSECGLSMNISLSWPFVAFSYFAGASVNLNLPPNILMFLFSHSLIYYQILYKMCHFTYFSSVETCLPGNIVL